MQPVQDRRRRFRPFCRRAAIAFAVSTAVVAGLSVPTAQAQEAADAPAAEAPIKPGERFIRYRDLRNGGVLETSIVSYANDAGQQVDLIGAVHVGDEAYYDLLDEKFAGYDRLLYEMVKPKDVDMAQRNRAEEDVPFVMQLIGGLQKAMQLALELDFQTEEIDYAAPNFVHADLDLETFLRLQEERGESFFDLIVEQMIRDLTRPQEAAANQPQISMFEIMDAMNAPDRARRLKLIFARELSRMDDLSNVFAGSGEDGSVILDVRNEKAMEVLDRELARGDARKLGVFYGAAHLKGMDELLKERGFEQQGEPEYLVAWDMTLDGQGRREMQERTRQAIIDNAGGAAAGGEGGEGAGPAVAALRSEVKALRTENDALRRQVTALRQQLDAEPAATEQ